MKKEQFDITGMTCSACQARIEKVVSQLDGVSQASVNLLKNSMTVTFDEQRIVTQDIIHAVDKTGYGATPHRSNPTSAASNPSGNPMHDALKQMKNRLAISLLFTIPLFYLAMGHMVGLPIPSFFTQPDHALAYAFTQFLLTLPVFVVNFHYFRAGFKALFSGAPNMDSLIGLGAGAAIVYGIYIIYKISFALGAGELAQASHFSMQLYFESAAMILTLITLGKYFETRAKGKTSDAITKLMNLAPKTATRQQQNGNVQVISTDEVHVGDILIVKAGESIPVDGIITEGQGFIDESTITGESLPTEKQVGDKITGATINQSGYFLMQATRVGEDTTLSQIVKLVDEATSSKAPIAKLADKISGIFVPVVITIAVLATIIWLLLGHDLEFALSIGISVLVISCPCALGLATPTAIMVGTGRGAANGILFKSAQAIETMQQINTIVLDKTGTITEGKPVVTDIVTQGVTEQDLLRIAASLENQSEHPLGLAIVKESEKQALTLSPVTQFTQTRGQGISGQIGEQRYFAGNRQLMQAQHIPLSGDILATAESYAAAGKTPLFFANSQTLLGLITVADQIKPTSQSAVAALERMGINVIMMTGDNAKTAAAIQQQAGIEHILAEVLPQDKAQQVRQLQEQGKKVAMVGDGINDAPALAQADVGLAIGAGTDIAIESADIVLMKSDLLDVVTAIELSQAVMRNIKENLFWAFIYNAAGIPVAAGLFYAVWQLTLNPMIAAAAMSLSSVSVVSNALRLRFFNPTRTGQVKHANLSVKSTLSNNITQQDNRSLSMEKQLTIDGMTCGHCRSHVEKALQAVPGVTEVSVDLANKSAHLKADASVSNEALTKAVSDAGYQVVEIK
ncbi:heavy metal translocating P-type ATPase [Utexia brackfieldae]|uniref:heavy metal translocating P-type ATPase n=1 Tax=Utexia brackfieldae TaxID=3074108 RepID=UPI00370DC2CC